MLLAERSGQRRRTDFHEVRLKSRQYWLGLWVAEAAVEFNDPGRAVRHDHQSGIQETQVRVAIGLHSLERGAHDAIHDLPFDLGCDHRRR